MLNLLRHFLDEKTGFQEFDKLLGKDDWNSLDIDYWPPRVERVWRQHGENRILLHRIHPCKPEAALWHSHDWPSAMLVAKGRYEHRLGFIEGLKEGDEISDFKELGHRVRVVATTVLEEGCVYEMTDPLAFHSVRPLDAPALTLMVAGPPWPRERRINFPKPRHPQEPLAPEVVKELLTRFCNAI